MKSEAKISEIYKELFHNFLNFCPNYRRNVIELSEMYNWLNELGLKKRIFSKEDFCILMEWYNSLNLIKPFFIVYFPPHHKHHICLNESEELTNDIKNSNLKNLFDDGIILFPDEIYDIKPLKNIDTKPWDYKKIKHEIMAKPKSAKETDPEIKKIAIEETRYYYHPIQFFQLLTYMRSGGIPFTLENYKRFYWIRRLRFDDKDIERIKKHLKEKGITIQEYINKKASKGAPFHQLTQIYYSQNRWLIERSLMLWIKIESYLSPSFYYEKNRPNIDMSFQISKFEMFDKKKFEQCIKQYNEWTKEVNENFNKYFKEDEYHNLKEFKEYLGRFKNVDGLENFIDLFLQIDHDIKAKLKGFPNYFVNIVEIYKSLVVMEDEFFRQYSQLSKFKTERKWFEPQYFFENENDLDYHKKKIFLDYGLTQSETYVIFVEGPTESILLKDWIQLIFYRTNVRLSIKELEGRRNKFIFEILTKKFNVNEFFLVLDQDTEEGGAGLKGDLMGKGIREDSFYIFYPDFVTANFSVSEIFQAFQNFFKELKEDIATKNGKQIELSKGDGDSLLQMLNNKNNIDKFEDIIELFLQQYFKNPDYRLKKTKFAKHLSEGIMNTILNKDKREPYPFEKIMGKFVNRIQSIRFPES